MAFTKEQMLVAKTIRQNEAAERNCKLKDIKWAECVKLSFNKNSEQYKKAMNSVENKKKQFKFGCIDILGMSASYMRASNEEFKSDVDGAEITVQQVEELLNYCKEQNMANVMLNRNFFGEGDGITPEGDFIEDEYYLFLGEMLQLVVSKVIGLKGVREIEDGHWDQSWVVVA